GRLNAVDGSAEIDVDHPVPDLDRVVAELAAHGDAGIVEEVVEAALLLGDPLDQTFHAVEVRDVEGACGGRPCAPGRDVCGSVRDLRLEIGKNNRRPSSRKFFRKCAADARSRTGDDRHGTLEAAKA